MSTTRKVAFAVVPLIVICVAVLSILAKRHASNVTHGRKAQAELISKLNATPVILLREPNPVPTAEFMELLPNAVKRATVIFDPERTRNRWACACAFSVQIDAGTNATYLDQHHLLLHDKYYHLDWLDDDLSSLIELWNPTPSQATETNLP